MPRTIAERLRNTSRTSGDDREIDVALAIALLDVGEAVPLVGQRAQRLRDEPQPLREDRQLAGLASRTPGPRRRRCRRRRAAGRTFAKSSASRCSTLRNSWSSPVVSRIGANTSLAHAALGHHAAGDAQHLAVDRRDALLACGRRRASAWCLVRRADRGERDRVGPTSLRYGSDPCVRSAAAFARRSPMMRSSVDSGVSDMAADLTTCAITRTCFGSRSSLAVLVACKSVQRRRRQPVRPQRRPDAATGRGRSLREGRRRRARSRGSRTTTRPRSPARSRRTLPIVLDLWAPWCHTCMSMQTTVFIDPSFAGRARRSSCSPRSTPIASRTRPPSASSRRLGVADVLRDRRRTRAVLARFVGAATRRSSSTTSSTAGARAAGRRHRRGRCAPARRRARAREEGLRRPPTTS